MSRLLEVYGNNSHLLIKTQLAETISKAVEGCYLTDCLGDGTRLCVPWDLETTQAVAQWRIPTLSPMLRDYDFIGRFEPYLHQLKICSFLSANKRAFCLADMGTGKSASVVWTLDYLFKTNRIKRVLIIGVLTNLKSTWESEFFSINPQYETTVLHGDRAERAKLASNDAPIHIINHDGVETVIEQLMKNDYDVIVLDELTAYKNSRSSRFKITAPLCAKATYVWGLTGTPMPNSPDEVYGQIKIVNPTNLHNVTFSRFKDMVMRKITNFIWKPRYDAANTVQQYMQPAIKIDKAEVLALPTVTRRYEEVPLTKEQMAFYKELKDKQLVEQMDISISAVNGGALMSKLLQVATGAIYSDDGDPLAFDVTPKIDVLIKEIKEARAKSTDPEKGKTLVFAPFRHTVELLRLELEKHFTVRVVTGDTPAAERAAIFLEFQTTAKPDVILAVPRTMSHGVTATAASKIVWFGPVTSNEVYQQACNRIDRPGQTQEMEIVHLYSSAVEETIYKTLQHRKLSQTDLLNLYTDFIKGV